MLIRTALSLGSPAGERASLSILIFHRVLPAPDPLFPAEADTVSFDMNMRWVRDWFNVLPLEEAVERLKKGSLPACAAVITFDDGYADNLLHAAPILQRYGLHATFFIASGFLDGGRMWNDTLIESVRNATVLEIDCSDLGLGRLSIESVAEKRTALERLIPAIKHLPGEARMEKVERVREACAALLPEGLMMTSTQLRALRELGMGIGAHTCNHPILAKTDPRIAQKEITENKDFLEALLGEKIRLFAYPNGKLGQDYTAEHVEMVRQAGFSAAVTTNWGVSNRQSDYYQLPRFTPWDTRRLRYGLRLLLNLRHPVVSA